MTDCTVRIIYNTVRLLHVWRQFDLRTSAQININIYIYISITVHNFIILKVSYISAFHISHTLALCHVVITECRKLVSAGRLQ